jgi:drug/metabolite transporter (DMT)-like permease
VRIPIDAHDRTSLGPFLGDAGGLVILGPIVAVSSVPLHLQAASFGLLVVAGVTNVLGLLLSYRALRIGKVGVVAPVLSAQGAVAALIAVAAGESIGRGPARSPASRCSQSPPATVSP